MRPARELVKWRVFAAGLLWSGVLSFAAAQGPGRWTTGAPALSARSEIVLAEVAGGRIHVIAGGPTPGGSASSANEIFTP